jgi:hypothetical protein
MGNVALFSTMWNFFKRPVIAATPSEPGIDILLRESYLYPFCKNLILKQPNHEDLLLLLYLFGYRLPLKHEYCSDQIDFERLNTLNDALYAYFDNICDCTIYDLSNALIEMHTFFSKEDKMYVWDECKKYLKDTKLSFIWYAIEPLLKTDGWCPNDDCDLIMIDHHHCRMCNATGYGTDDEFLPYCYICKKDDN